MKKVFRSLDVGHHRPLTTQSHFLSPKRLHIISAGSMDAQTEVVIGKEAGGIPVDKFKTGTNEIISGISGSTKLDCLIANNLVIVKDANHHKFHFEAHLSPANLLSFSVNNKGWEGDPEKKHPDIFPGKLVQATIKEFEKQGGKVEGIIGTWKNNPGGEMVDNFNEYRANLAGIEKNDITDEDRQAAAKNTPTGKIAAAAGYTEVSEILEDVDDNNIEAIFVTFRKPASNASL